MGVWIYRTYGILGVHSGVQTIEHPDYFEGRAFHGVLDMGAEASVISLNHWPNAYPCKNHIVAYRV